MKKETKSTAYDDVFRTLLNDCTRLIIPVINEAFQTHYDLNTKIRLLNNELYTAGANEKTGRKSHKRETDAQIQFANLENQLFHIECQSTRDGTMSVRMFEYDTAMAINKSRMDGNTLVVDYPRSAVLYLREQSELPDTLEIKIRTSEGELSHRVPVIKTQRYSVADIFEKQLYFLIPFYLFRYEKQFPELQQNPEKMQLFHADYIELFRMLNRSSDEENTLRFLEKTALKDLSRAVAKRLTADRFDEVEEEVNSIMGGKILDYESKTAYRNGLEDGEKRGEKRGEARGERRTIIAKVCKKIEKGKSISEIADALEETPETIAPIYSIAKEQMPDFDVTIIYEKLYHKE